MAQYAVLVEFKDEGPILMETTDTSIAAADATLKRMIANNRCIRAAIVSLEYVCGNKTLLNDGDKQ